MSFEQEENITASPEKKESRELFEQDFLWENDPKNADEAQQLVEKKLMELGWDEDQAFSFSLAIAEAMVNAIVHGNLGVNREKGENEYTAAIKTAQEQEENKAKRVELFLRFTPDEATARIKDAGDYVPERIDDPTSDENLLKGSKRGLGMIFMKVDNLQFFPGEIILQKRRKDNEDSI